MAHKCMQPPAQVVTLVFVGSAALIDLSMYQAKLSLPPVARTVLRLQPTARRDDQERTDGVLFGALGIHTFELPSAGTLARARMESH